MWGLSDWGNNYFLLYAARKTGIQGLQAVVASGWVRGAVSGVGLLNLGIAFWEIFNFRISSRRRHTRYWRDWSSDVCSSDLDGRRSSHSLFRRAQVDEAYPIAGCRSVPAPPYLLQYLWTIQREAMMSDANVFVGKWTYRSWLNDVNLATSPNDLLFGSGTIDI